MLNTLKININKHFIDINNQAFIIISIVSDFNILLKTLLLKGHKFPNK